MVQHAPEMSTQYLKIESVPGDGTMVGVRLPIARSVATVPGA
jgi:hypothetical protein